MSAFLLGSCTSEDEDVASDRSELQRAGAWSPPASTLMQADTQFVARDPAGTQCASGMTDGALALKAWALGHFPHLPEVQGFNCRVVAGSNSLSVHSVGRALDIMIPPIGDRGELGADNDLGDPIANWFIEHAEEIGVQYLVWDQMQWSGRQAAGQKFSSYGGSNPHVDHIHLELTLPASRMETPFFQNSQPAPEGFPPCELVPKDGAILEVFGPCVDFRDQVNASNRAWRTVPGGLSGATRWTGGWQSDAAEAEVDYALSFASAGQYEIEVYLDAAYAEFTATHYNVHHAGGVDVVNLDQSTGTEWASLGQFEFEANTSYVVELTDNQPDPGVFQSSGRISVDAMRITPLAVEGDEDDDNDGDADGDDEESPSDDVLGGCSANPSQPPLGAALLLLLGLIPGLVRRRRT